MAENNNKGLEKRAMRRINDYLNGNRDDVVLDMAFQLNEKHMEKIVPHLKKEIYEYVKFNHEDFDGKVCMKDSAYKIMENFDTNVFKMRNWKHKPFYLKKTDFDVLQGCVKNMVDVKRYKTDKPIYQFGNTFVFPDNRKHGEKKGEHYKSDMQFYISQNEDMLFGKFVSLKFKPKELASIKNLIAKSENKKDIVYNRYLYDRSLTITHYVFLDGDPNKAMPYMRYDNDLYIHTNVFIGKDKRKRYFGESADCPHFHFQNEDDALLCLRKFRSGKDGKIKYRTGRCNAIDCRHLKEYLHQLDMQFPEYLKEHSDEWDFGMPFLNLKVAGKKIDINVENIFNNYLKLNGGGTKKLYEVSQWLEETASRSEYKQFSYKYKNSTNHSNFTGLIRALDFIDYITTLMKVKMDVNTIKMLSDIEVEIANSIMSAINLNSSTKTMKDGKPKYVIDMDFDEKS